MYVEAAVREVPGFSVTPGVRKVERLLFLRAFCDFTSASVKQNIHAFVADDSSTQFLNVSSETKVGYLFLVQLW